MSADYNPDDICYLCSNRLGTVDVSEDHVFQRQFISRHQPKARGFHYAGTLPVHGGCNNKFGGIGKGPEWICKKSLQLLEVLYSPATQKRVCKDNPRFRVVAIDSSALPNFTKEDLEFFQINDLRNVPYQEWSSGRHLSEKAMINPFERAINISLSTLAKSAAGFLVKSFAYPKQGRWRVLSIPHIGQTPDFDLGPIFGNATPLEVGVSLWVKPECNGWFLGYKHDRLLVFFAFESVASDFFQQVCRTFKNASCLFFDSDKLIDLVGYGWSKNKYPL